MIAGPPSVNKRLEEHLIGISKGHKRDFRWESLGKLVRKYARGRRVLDVGCGTGHITLGLLKAGYEVTAIDTSTELVQFTRRMLLDRGFETDVRVLNLMEIERLSRKFDTIICLDVFEHVKDDILFIEGLSKVLEPKGRIIVSAPAFRSLYGPRDRQIGHLRRYQKTELSQKLTQASLSILQLRYWNFLGFFVVATTSGKLFHRGIYDRIRYSADILPKAVNTLLRYYFWTVENNVEFPVGLTLFAVCEK